MCSLAVKFNTRTQSVGWKVRAEPAKSAGVATTRHLLVRLARASVCVLGSHESRIINMAADNHIRREREIDLDWTGLYWTVDAN